MSKIYDGQPDYQQGGDSGQNTASSIQPINNAENLYAANLNRAVENVRVRTEEIRQQLLDLHYYSDYDRGFILKSNALFSFIEPDPGGDPGRYELVMTGDNLVILPALTPGYTSGGRDRGAKMFTQQGGNWVPYGGTLGADDLTFITSAQFTGMRGYNDANDFNVDLNGFTLGGNRLTLTLVANPTINGGVATMTATVTGSPAVDITITYGTLTPTTVADIITFVNTDAASQGGYGLSAILRASTTSPGLAAPPTITGALFQGGYDAEGHKITPAMLSAFFAATDGLGNKINRLRDGESLAIAYTYGPVESGVAGANGGRRQSLYDLPANRLGAFTDNTAPAVGWNLYNTGREPEKIPGSVPVGKRVNNVFVLLDGTIVTTTPSRLGESSAMLARLASIVSPTGASLIGYGGSGPWHPDDGTSIPAGTLEASLDAVVSGLASDGIGTDGALKIGAGPHTGVPSLGNLPFNLSASSINVQIDALLNGAASPSSGGGINYRVSEYGHVLKGYNPISKDLSALATAGGQRFAAQLTFTGIQDVAAPVRGSRAEYADVIVQPLAVLNTILQAETIGTGTANDRVELTEATIAGRFLAMAALLPSMQTYSEAAPATKALSACIMVEIAGSVPGPGFDGNGYYLFSKLVDTGLTKEVQLVRLSGASPDFSGTNLAAATLTFLNTNIRGSNSSSNFERSYHLAEDFAEKVVACPTTVTPWLETYYSNPAGPSADAIKGSYHMATRSVWNPTAPAPRNTDNILIPGDKQLLSGMETGIPVSAALNHHHGPTYTRHHRISETAVTFVNAAVLAIPLTTLSAPGGDYIQLPSAPFGFRNVGAIIAASVFAPSNPLLAQYSSVDVAIRAVPGAAYVPTGSTQASYFQYLKVNAGPSDDDRYFYNEFTVDCTATSLVAFQQLSPITNAGPTAVFSVKVKYLIITPTTAIAGQTGVLATVGPISLGAMQINGVTGMTPGSVGNFLELSGGLPQNEGVFRIVGYVSPTSVLVRGPYMTVDGANYSWAERLPG